MDYIKLGENCFPTTLLSMELFIFADLFCIFPSFLFHSVYYQLRETASNSLEANIKMLPIWLTVNLAVWGDFTDGPEQKAMTKCFCVWGKGCNPHQGNKYIKWSQREGRGRPTKQRLREVHPDLIFRARHPRTPNTHRLFWRSFIGTLHSSASLP